MPFDQPLSATDFELFGVPARFEQDAGLLQLRWKDLQRQAHPDRFAGQGQPTQRLALQYSARINEAYQRLRQPLSRAAYLCELHGAPIEAERNTTMPATFLHQQMQWRDMLEEASAAAQVQALADEVQAVRLQTLARCAHLLDQQRDYGEAAAQVRALMFLDRFAATIDARLEQLGQ